MTLIGFNQKFVTNIYGEMQMTTAAMVLGIIWGVILTLYAIYAYYAGKLGSAVGVQGSEFVMIASVLVPLLVFVGAGSAKSKPIIAGVLLLVPGLIILWLIGINGLGIFFGGPVLIAAGLAFFGAKEVSEKSSVATKATSGPSA
jgi:hypothetical protein